MDKINSPKIAWIELVDHGRFCLLDGSICPVNTVYSVAIDDPYYLLGVLNSELVSWYFSFITATSGAGTKRLTKQYVENIPVPLLPDNKAIIEGLVRKIMEDPKNGEIQKQIDMEVCKAYGLTETEIQYLLSEAN